MWNYLIFSLMAFCLIIQTSTVLADAESEHAALAQLTHELDALAPLIKKAQTQANPDARIRFQYSWLNNDLERMKTGIREHINAPRTYPRTFPPLKGDYRH
jgi:RAQPRD family integrative conjugative element protein